MDYGIISADGHIDLTFLPGDLFTANAPFNWRKRMPRVVEGKQGPEWRANGIFLSAYMSRYHTELTPENEERIARIEQTGFFDDAAKGEPHPTTPELRLKDQDLDGVDAEVIYGLTFVGSRLLGVHREPGSDERITPDPDLVFMMYRIYNDWLADFCAYDPARLLGLACLPNHDSKAAVEELRRAAQMGLKGAELVVQGAAVPIYCDEWDGLWRAAAECRMPISFHLLDWFPSLPPAREAQKYLRIWHTMDMVLSPLYGAEYASAVILSGACERYPEFKFVLGECGVSWIGYLLDRLDHECQGFGGLKLRPSEYWRRQGYTTYQDEGLVGDWVQFVGEDNVLWGSDYPHPDSVWPDSLSVIDRNLKNLKDQSARKKIICDNAATLYGLK